MRNIRAKYQYRAGSLVPASKGSNGVLLTLLIFSTCLASYKRTSFGSAPADIPILIALALGLFANIKHPHYLIWNKTMRPVLLAIAFYALVCVLPALSGGNFYLLQTVKDLFSFLIFPATYLTLARITDRKVANRAVSLGLGLSIFLVAVTALPSNGTRADGIFGSPNLGGNWAALVIVFMAMTKKPNNPVLRYTAITLMIFASLKMASLGGILCLAGALAFWLPRKSSKIKFGKYSLPIFLLLGSSILLRAFDALTGLDRFSRSSEGRLTIWGNAIASWFEKPLGVGIGNFSDGSLGLASAPEAHNDYISSLVELGFLGPISIGLICIAMGFYGGAMTRSIVLFYALSAISHNSINFRHIWVFMAICLAYETLPIFQSEEQIAPPTKSQRIKQLRRNRYSQGYMAGIPGSKVAQTGFDSPIRLNT